ncbi:MAG: alpha/beta fold hydrolase [Ferruginibacter sp.]
MKKVILSFLVFFMAHSVVGQVKTVHGQWIGKIIKDGKEWSTELNFYSNGHELTGDFDLPDYGLHHLVFNLVQIRDTIVHCEYSDKNSKAFFNGTLKGNQISGGWEGLSMKAVFSKKKYSNTAIRFRSEDVVFSNGDAKLAGTLILPYGKGPFPAIVQVHGSGNQTRTEDFYRSRAYLFARNGIAVLIYDRRGKGIVDTAAKDRSQVADDAIAGVHFLQQHTAIKKNKVGIMGFSQGGYVGPLAASRSDDIAFVIAGSAPGITPDEQNDFDVENGLRNRRVSEDSITYVLNFRKDLRNYQYNNIGSKEELENKLSALRTKSWFRNTLLTDASVSPVSQRVKEWLTFNPLPVWKKVKEPKLLIWGELDNVAPVSKSKELIDASLKQAGYKNYLLKVYKNASHGIAVINNGKEWDWPRLAEGYHQLMVNWVKQVVKN